MTRYAALGIRAIPSLHKLLFLVDPKLHLYGENLEMLIFFHSSCYRASVFEQRSHRGLVAVDEGTEYSAWVMQ